MMACEIEFADWVLRFGKPADQAHGGPDTPQTEQKHSWFPKENFRKRKMATLNTLTMKFVFLVSACAFFAHSIVFVAKSELFQLICSYCGLLKIA